MKGIIRLKGSATSGNWGHMGRPGMVGGSDKGGGFGRLAGYRPDLSPDELRQEAAIQRFNLKRKKAEAKLQLSGAGKILGGYDVNSITFSGAGYEFNVGNDQFVAAGDYNTKTGKIRLFDDAFSENMGGVYLGIVAHEIEHDKYNRWEKDYRQQNADVAQRLRQEMIEGKYGKDSFMRADGTFRSSDDTERYSAVVLYDKYFSGDNWDTLKAKDGITNYSKSYWNKFRDTRMTMDAFVAINETLAEVARLRLDRADELKSVDPLWVEIYDAINEASK